MKLTTPTSDPRHKWKPCPACGRKDWFYGTKKRCHFCRDEEAKSPAGRQKYLAQRQSAKAVRDGVLIRQPCVICHAYGSDQRGKSHGHHEDYSKPLDVIWLCSFHHHARHAELRCGSGPLTADEMIAKDVRGGWEFRARVPTARVAPIPEHLIRKYLPELITFKAA